MKKLVTVMLIVVLALVPAISLAETAYERYTNETIGYSIDYPADWTLVSKETMAAIGDAAVDSGMADADSQLMETYRASVEQMDMAVFAAPDFLTNVNITYSEVPMKLTHDYIVTYMYPMVLEQFKGIFGDYTELMEPTTEMAGDNEFTNIAGTYSLNGVQVVVMQSLISTDSTFYTITFTFTLTDGTDLEAFSEISEHMASSFGF